MSRIERYRVVIIGAGQAGLTVGRQLVEAGVDVLILEAAQRIGDAWRRRWDALRLFTAAEHIGLPGLPFPADPYAFPTKDQVADYLEEYARRFRLRVRFGTRVDALERRGRRFVMAAGERRFEADQVVIATGPYQSGRIPAWAAHLDRGILQIHSEQYQNTSQLGPGPVLVVGAGNTGAELALAAASAGHRVLLSGRDVGEVPFFFRWANGRIFWFLATRVITAQSAIGRRIRDSVRAGHGGPLVRIRKKDLADAGIERVARVAGSQNGRPLLEDGRVLDVANIVWCSGFRLNFSWVRLPIFAPDGYPLHENGRVPAVPGLYFIGLPFQRSLSSSTLVGVGRDAALIAGWIVDSLERRDAFAARDRHEHHDSRRLFRYAEDPSLLQEAGRTSSRGVD